MSTATAPPLAHPRLDEACRLEFDPRLVEESVLLAIDSQPPETRRRFRSRRDPLYEIHDPGRREAAFHRLHGRWFVRLGLADTVRSALAREPTIVAATSRCLVVPVASAREEYADLRPDRRHQRPPTLWIGLRVTTLVDRGRLLPLLRHELLHVADMLDPEFGFEPELPLLDDSAPLESLFRQRYQTLWDTTIDGRLLARGGLPMGGEDARRREFLGVFSMLGESGERWFERFFHGPRPRHAELVAFAAEPGDPEERSAHNRCPVCRMPTATLHPAPAGLAPGTIAAIRRDLPGWEPARGLCLQCADLYANPPPES